MKWRLDDEYLTIRFEHCSNLTKKRFLLLNFVNHIKQQNKINMLRHTYLVLFTLMQCDSSLKFCSFHFVPNFLKHPFLQIRRNNQPGLANHPGHFKRKKTGTTPHIQNGHAFVNITS